MYLLLVPKKLYKFFLQNETDFIKKFEFLVLQNFIQLVQSILAIALFVFKNNLKFTQTTKIARFGPREAVIYVCKQ